MTASSVERVRAAPAQARFTRQAFYSSFWVDNAAGPSAYRADGRHPRAVEHMYGAAIILAINDAGRPWPEPPKVRSGVRHSKAIERFGTMRAIVDGMKLILDPSDTRRYALATAAGIDPALIDRWFAALLDPKAKPHYGTGGLLPGTAARIRERAAHPRALRRLVKNVTRAENSHPQPVAPATIGA